MFGVAPFYGTSHLRALSSSGGHQPVPLSVSSPAVAAASVSQVDLLIVVPHESNRIDPLRFLAGCRKR